MPGNIPKIKSKQTKNFFKKLLGQIAEHPFLTFLILVFIALIIGGWQFYQYSILAQRAKPEISEAKIQFKENLYQEILSEWQSREERFESAQTKEYPNPFQS